MTKEQRAQVEKLRLEGFGYNKIAGLLSVPENTVKSYCRSHNLTGKRAEADSVSTDTVFCRNCGKPLVQPKGAKPMKFCCAACRIAWWNTHPEAVNRKAYYSATCAHCGKTFISYGNDHRKYCCHACYIANRFGKGLAAISGTPVVGVCNA